MRIFRSSTTMLVASVCAAAAIQVPAASLLPLAAPAPLLGAHDRALLASSDSDDTLFWSQLPAFYDSSDAAAAPIRSCTGALVAPRFVLTTAACATQHRIAKVSFTQGTDATLSRAVVASVTHPRFELTGPSRYNVALLELAAPLPFATLTLDFAPALAGDQLVRVSSWDKQVTNVSVASLAACAGESGLVTLPSDNTDGSLVCLGSALSSESQRGSSILVYKAASTALLSGFELPREAGVSRVYVGMRGIANFINAVADDLRRIPSDTDTDGSVDAGSNVTNAHTNDELSNKRTDADSNELVLSNTDTDTGPADSVANEYVQCNRSSPIADTGPADPATNDADTGPADPATDDADSKADIGADGPPTPMPSPPPAYPRAWYPYVATLHIKRGGKSFCGGTLVGPYHVLTAAHCVADGVVNWVALGSGTGALQEIPVARVTLHPRYKPESMLYDAAVLELGNFADSTRWVTLDAARDYPDQTIARMVSGITMSTTFVNALSLPIWARAKCEAQYPEVSTPVLCAGGNAGVDACAGNSGSPLIRSSSGNGDVDVLVGIVSAGFGCGTRGVPGFYTRIASVADFVAQFTIPAIPNPSMLPSMLPTAVPSSYAAPGLPTNSPGVSSITGGGGRTTQTPVAALSGTATPYPSSIRSATLDPEVTPLAKAKALVFLAGEYENSLVSRTLWTKIVDPTNAVVLYSTGDLQGVLSVIKQRSALPLNQRLDRFKTVEDREQRTSPSQC